MSLSTATIYRVTEKDYVPGPDKYSPPGDFGNNSLKYTIGRRLTSKSARGPGYENVPTTIGESQKWSLSSRHKEGRSFITPAPTYIPPKMGSDLPAAGFHQRITRSARSVSPGPQYDTREKEHGLKWTMKARNFRDEGKPFSPGPGGYRPDYEKVMPSSRKTQILSVINRKERNETPGPKYDIDRSLKNQPQSFHSRIDLPRKDFVPGPGKYEPEKHVKSESPSYSLRSRVDPPVDVIRPSIQNIRSDQNEGLKYSLSSRPKDLSKPVVPGPSYIPPPLGSEATKCALSSRRERKRDIAKEPPGPGQYKIEPPNEGKKWTMKARNFREEYKIAGPGAGKYLPGYEKVMPAPRRNQILERFHDRKENPGPGYYDLGSTFAQPKITIGRKETLAIRPGVG